MNTRTDQILAEMDQQVTQMESIVAGIETSDDPGAQLDKLCDKYRKKHDCDYAVALKAVLAANPDLASRWRLESFSTRTMRTPPLDY